MSRATCEAHYPPLPLREIHADRDFRFRTAELFSPLVNEAPPRVRDLLALSAHVYTIDRLVRRSYLNEQRGPARVLELRVAVSDPPFWNDPMRSRRIHEILHVLSGDQWSLHFDQAPPRQWQPTVLRPHATVCLYSGGLDSLAGLALRLKQGLSDVVSVTMRHIPRQRARIEHQLSSLNAHFGSRIYPVFVRMALVRPPRLDDQEQSQRCRAFIFASLGVAAACAAGAETIEMYESGVGAVNVPLMTGMSVGGRTTKACHPRFLRLMSELASDVVGRNLRVAIPFADMTKAEVTRVLKVEGLEALGHTTFSCIHTSPRKKGEPRQCGTCPACIGRRQAFVAAGIDEPPDAYDTDIFNAGIANNLKASKLLYLKAMLMQVSEFADCAPGRLPRFVEHYVRSSGVVADGGSIDPWASVLGRYRDEWLALVARARQDGLRWASWIE